MGVGRVQVSRRVDGLEVGAHDVEDVSWVLDMEFVVVENDVVGVVAASAKEGLLLFVYGDVVYFQLRLGPEESVNSGEEGVRVSVVDGSYYGVPVFGVGWRVFLP